MGAAGIAIVAAGGYIASTNGISAGNLVADLGAVLGLNKNKGELVAVIPLDKSVEESEAAPVKIQDKKLSRIEPKKTETISNPVNEQSSAMAIVSPSEAPAAQNVGIESQQPMSEAQPQPVIEPEPAPQEPALRPESAPEPAQQPEPIKVLISEIQAGTTQNGTEDEFVELYNPTNSVIDMSDWSLVKKTSSGSSYNLVSSAVFSGSIAPKSFFLVAHKNFKGVKQADLIYSANSNNLAYTNNSVVLYDVAENIMDEAAWNELPKNNSLERKALVNGVCVSAQNENELNGNGCDMNSASDFELRGAPNSQNSFDTAE